MAGPPRGSTTGGRLTQPPPRGDRHLGVALLVAVCLHNAAWLWYLRGRDVPLRDNLVLYTFVATDPELVSNLHFFVREAVQRDARSDYIIVVQQATDIPVSQACGHAALCGQPVTCR